MITLCTQTATLSFSAIWTGRASYPKERPRFPQYGPSALHTRRSSLVFRPSRLLAPVVAHHDGRPARIPPPANLFDGVAGHGGGRYDSEMDYVNSRYAEKSQCLAPFYTLLVSEFVPGDRVVAYFSRLRGEAPPVVLEAADFVHFIACWKPWLWTVSAISYAFPEAPLALFDIIDHWRGAAGTHRSRL
jgi:hypothetical protein